MQQKKHQKSHKKSLAIEGDSTSKLQLTDADLKDKKPYEVYQRNPDNEKSIKELELKVEIPMLKLLRALGDKGTNAKDKMSLKITKFILSESFNCIVKGN